MQLCCFGVGFCLSLLFHVAVDSAPTPVNLAYGKIAKSNSLNTEVAERAVDPYTWDSCATINTWDDKVPAWWQVDLGMRCFIDRVMIVGPSSDDYKSLSYFDVTVSSNNKTSSFAEQESCYEQRDPSAVSPEAVLHLPCKELMIGRYITIRRLTSQGQLPGLITLCDVRVMGVTSIDNRV